MAQPISNDNNAAKLHQNGWEKLSEKIMGDGGGEGLSAPPPDVVGPDLRITDTLKDTSNQREFFFFLPQFWLNSHRKCYKNWTSI